MVARTRRLHHRNPRSRLSRPLESERVIHVTLEPLSADSDPCWRELQVADDQIAYVTTVDQYVAMCETSEVWEPLLIRAGEQVVGFVMRAVDPDDGSYVIGGLLVDRSVQRKGYGRQAVHALLDDARERGHDCVALSYHPQNLAARRLYGELGFVESDETTEEGEIVARLRL